MYVGYRLIVINHTVLRNTGYSPAAHPDILTLKFFRRRGVYNDSHMQAINQLWNGLLRNRGREVRIALDYVESSACAFAVRTAIRQLRHRHVTPWADGIEATGRELLRRLEALRKRRKRAIIKTKGEQFFREHSSSWREFLKWLRLHVLTCCPRLVRRPNLFYRSQRLLIDTMCRVTKAEMQKSGNKIPDESIFRKLVRDGLKNVRRYRSPFTLPLLRRNPEFADWWFAEYVTRRMASKRS
jgi:hypothetical protein